MFVFQEEFNVKMLVIQELTDIDGIEHKPLRITGEPDRVEVSHCSKRAAEDDRSIDFSVLNNTCSIPY